MAHIINPSDELPSLERILADIPRGRALQVELTVLWMPPGRKALRLNTVDPAAPNRKPHLLCPLLVGDEGQTHADLLELVAGALRLADEHAAQRELGLHGE